MTDSQISQLLSWWLIINLTLVTAYDLWVLMTGANTPTVSYWLYELGRRQPLIYLWLGVTIGHLLLPLVISNGK